MLSENLKKSRVRPRWLGHGSLFMSPDLFRNRARKHSLQLQEEKLAAVIFVLPLPQRIKLQIQIVLLLAVHQEGQDKLRLALPREHELIPVHLLNVPGQFPARTNA